MLIEWLTAAAILTGAAFTLIGSLGLLRFPDFFARLHGPTKATTLGVGGMLAASMLHFSSQSGSLSVGELLIALFLFMTAPVSANLAAKAALHLRVESLAPLPEGGRTSRPQEPE